jgi:hypothetical protein
MKYFTRERYLALQNFEEAAMDAADADWEEAVERYDAYLQSIRPELPESVRQLLEGFYLHDARVLSMGQRGETFVISLQLDVPPNELVTITYTLAGPPEVKTETFPWADPAAVVDWLYEEIELVREGDGHYFVHSILFGNGWEVRIPFRAVHLATAFPLLPLPHSRRSVQAPGPASQTA